MKKLNLFLTLGIALFLFGQINAQPPKCNGHNSSFDHAIDELEVPATTAEEARAYLAKMVMLNASDWNLPKCKKCPKPNGKPCKLTFGGWNGQPSVQKATDSTYKVPEQPLHFHLNCARCLMPVIAAVITDPLNGTLAVCNGLANVVTLSMPAVVIFSADGDLIDVDIAMDYWQTMIILDNGNFIEGSVPWGCASTQCVDMGYEGGCQMSILESGDIPTPTFDEETMGWAFPETSFTMSYSCSSCGSGGDNNDNDATMGKTVVRKYAPASSIDQSGLIQQLFPNPASDYLTVTFGATKEKTMVSIVDITGKTVFSSNVNATSQKAMLQIDITDLAAGVYYLKATSGSQQSSKEFVIE